MWDNSDRNLMWTRHKRNFSGTLGVKQGDTKGMSGTEMGYQVTLLGRAFEIMPISLGFILDLKLDCSKRLRTQRTKFRLRHLLTGCYLFSHKVKLPEWGFEQQEVTCNRNAVRDNSLWYVETNTHPSCTWRFSLPVWRVFNEVSSARELPKG
ncbi:MIR motif-containing protein [Gautieria morchelliformis]|nr:MIR motif-containing protein [Gautieria morchelliformis]